jgi:hypothetical protein
MIDGVAIETRSFRFVLTFDVEPGHPAYDDPEWAADAVHGALTNEYDFRAIYTDIAEVTGEPSRDTR